ncbi:MAG: hypothetical protein MJZ37_09750, partial [Bacilli bacterium]|nr:hypothetical protein [Bacilli bacterium]
RHNSHHFWHRLGTLRVCAPSVDMPEDEAYKISFLKELLQDVEISRPEHVDYYMDYRNIINLI